MLKQMLFKKTIEELVRQGEGTGENSLKRTLTAWNLTALGIGAIIGAGIFVLTGQAAAQYAGPAIVWSFVLSAVACAFTGLCYAEFASMIPVSGSAYTYAYATLGEFIAWVIGWNLILEYLFAGSMVAVGWSGYVVSFLHDVGVNIPAEWVNATGAKLIQIPGEGWKVLTEQLSDSLLAQGVNPATLVHSTGIMNVPAIFIVMLVTYVLIIGIKESANVNNVIVFVKIAVILLFAFFGAKYVSTSNWIPFIPSNTGEFGEYGWSGILRGAGIVFVAYVGFDAVSTAAQEAKNPQRDMPIGILASLAVCTLIYIIVSLVLTGIVKYPLLNVPDPIAVAVNATGDGLRWLRPFVKIGAIAGLSSVVLVMMLGQTRIFYTMAVDGLLPKAFSRIHARFKTPTVPTLVTGGAALFFAGCFPISILSELVSIGTLLAFMIVCIGILVLRKTHPDLHRPFRTPWVPFVPIMGASISLIQMLGLPVDTWLRLVVWLAIGCAIYFLYGVRRKR